MAHAHCMLDTYGYKHTLMICNTHCFSTAIMVARTRLNVTFVRTLSVLFVLGKENEWLKGRRTLINNCTFGCVPRDSTEIVRKQTTIAGPPHHFAQRINQCTVQTFTESEDTRCCVNTIFPPEDGHVNARNMSRIIVSQTYC